jgi:hypothetical protein
MASSVCLVYKVLEDYKGVQTMLPYQVLAFLFSGQRTQ